MEKKDIRGLRVELGRFVGQMLRDHAEQIWSDQDWRVDVTDASGFILYVMHLSATDTAATMTLRR